MRTPRHHYGWVNTSTWAMRLTSSTPWRITTDGEKGKPTTAPEPKQLKNLGGDPSGIRSAPRTVPQLRECSVRRGDQVTAIVYPRSVCGEATPWDEFNLNRTTLSGLAGWCSAAAASATE